MSIFVEKGKAFLPSQEPKIVSPLPVGTYMAVDTGNGIALLPADNLRFDGKVYGNADAIVRRIMAVASDRKGSTGILLSGSYGSGKTMIAKRLAEESIKLGMSVILISDPITGTSLAEFLQHIDEPATVLVDEFEKVYSREDQRGLLAILDGVYSTKKLFVFTCNDLFGVIEGFKNRPGRIYYHVKYDSCPDDVVEDYCSKNIANQEAAKAIAEFLIDLNGITFDGMKAIVEEHNRFGEMPREFLHLLNVKPVAQNRTELALVGLAIGGVESNHRIPPGESLGGYSPFDLNGYVIHILMDLQVEPPTERQFSGVEAPESPQLLLGHSLLIHLHTWHLRRVDPENKEYVFVVPGSEVLLQDGIWPEFELRFAKREKLEPSWYDAF
jgi:hypothetical protein